MGPLFGSDPCTAAVRRMHSERPAYDLPHAPCAETHPGLALANPWGGDQGPGVQSYQLLRAEVWVMQGRSLLWADKAPGSLLQDLQAETQVRYHKSTVPVPSV